MVHEELPDLPRLPTLRIRAPLLGCEVEIGMPVLHLEEDEADLRV